jgi:hypothetical protein
MEGRGFSLVGSVDMCSVQGANQRSPDCEYRRSLFVELESLDSGCECMES